jgi:hypothetical protein
MVRIAVIVIAALASISPALAQTLTCSTWNGIRTCSGTNGYVSHETEWQGRTNAWDNRGDRWTTSRWQGFTTTTVEPPGR